MPTDKRAATIRPKLRVLSPLPRQMGTSVLESHAVNDALRQAVSQRQQIRDAGQR